jgi:hypothetical protein
MRSADLIGTPSVKSRADSLVTVTVSLQLKQQLSSCMYGCDVPQRLTHGSPPGLARHGCCTRAAISVANSAFTWGCKNGILTDGAKVGNEYPRMKQHEIHCPCHVHTLVTREEKTKKDHVKDLLCCCAGPISRKESYLAASRRRRKKAPTRPATWHHPRMSRGPASCGCRVRECMVHGTGCRAQ